MSNSVVIILPYPVSANQYWRSFVPRGASRPVTTLSEEAKAYKKTAGWIAKKAGITNPLKGRVRVHVQLYPKLPQDFARRAKTNPDYWDDDVRCIDLDNARKVLYDALKGIVFDDDKWIWSDSAERMQPDGEARVVVTVSRIIKNQIQPLLFDPLILHKAVLL